MDDETRQQFQQMREEIEESRNEFKAQFQSLVALVVTVKESLEREFRSTLDEELRPMKQALDRIEARLDRQGGIIQGGTRQVARLIDWSEEVDHLLAQNDQRFNEFERRLSKLEKPPQP